MLIDIRIRKYLWNRKLKAATKEAVDWGLEIPNAQTKARTTNVPHAVILELIHRNVRRKELLHEFEQYQSYPGQKGNSRKTPRIILRQKDVWSRPIATSTPGLIEVDLDESDMDSYIQRFEKNDNRTSDTFHQLERRAKDEFFFILFLSRHGGVYTNPFGNHDDHKKLLRWIESLDTATNDPQRGWVIIKDGILQSLIVPPNNEFLTCIKETSTDELKHSNVGMSSFHAIINEIASKDTDWNGNSKEFITLPQECTGINRLNFTRGSSNDPLTHQNRYRNMPVKEISVLISATNEPKPEYAHKTTIDQLLSRQSRFCQNLWIWPCHRCLKSALHGSYAKCSLFCGSCSDHMHAKEKIRSDDSTVQVNVDVSGYRVDGKTQMIPRIIHQTWFEDITPLHYPNLNRLQNSWKNSGWTYKFYTDDSARQYINDHFPNHFLQAYDALIPGAYKADLFRYMILMREGGVYADVDVLLDASLDTFVTPTMSFFAPRDAVAEYADGQYCLWNGLIGAAPGHQIIVRAVERLVNLILNRADILDLEKDVAQKAGIETETWKIRAVQELLLSGPCALGIATNEVLGKDPVARFDVGWVNSTTDIGDSMILMVSYFSL
jgi:hypothetical protein